VYIFPVYTEYIHFCTIYLLLPMQPECKILKTKYRIFRPITRALSIQKGSEIVKNEHARYTLERFPTDNVRVICSKKVSENTVLCIKHNFQLKLVCSIHSVALLNITLFKSKEFFIGLYIEKINRVSDILWYFWNYRYFRLP